MASLERKFKDRWPEMFENVCCGFYLPDGWSDLVWAMCEELEPLTIGTDFKVAQVKEKFGGLRFYVDGGLPAVHDIIDRYEGLSFSTCQNCGGQGVPRGDEWITTLCDTCSQEGIEQ